MKATSTLRYAFTDAWNLNFLALYGLILLISALGLLVSSGFKTLLLLLFFLLSLFSIVVQLWGMLDISLEVNDDGIKYKAAFRKVNLQWVEIETVHFEPFKKQITFWIKGKKVRIHRFGLNPSEYKSVENYMLGKIEENHILMK